MKIGPFYLILVAFFALAQTAAIGETNEQALPNVLLIFADDLGYGDIGCYGATKIKTPHIDSLAKEGMRFTNAYVTSSTCSQSRYSLMTGRYWWRCELHPPRGVVAPSGPSVLLEKGVKTLPQLFKESGYQTAAFGKWHLGVGRGTSPQDRYDWNRPEIEGGPLDVGFDYFWGIAANVFNAPQFYIENETFVGRKPGDRIVVESHKKVTPWSPDVIYKYDEVAGDITRNAVEHILNAPNDKPLFTYFATVIPHKPITPAKAFIDSSEAGIYGDFIQELDAQVGRLIDALRKTDRLENTLIVFVSDNGAVIAESESAAKRFSAEPMWEAHLAGHRANGVLRGGKHSVYEGGSRVPLIVRWPGRIAANQQRKNLASVTDLIATFAELLGEPVPESAVDSFSLYPQLMGHSEASPRDFVAAKTSQAIFSIRVGKWKLVEHDPQNPTGRKSENVDQLFDLENDPAEENNVYGVYPEVAARLKKQLAKVKLSKRILK